MLFSDLQYDLRGWYVLNALVTSHSAGSVCLPCRTQSHSQTRISTYDISCCRIHVIFSM